MHASAMYTSALLCMPLLCVEDGEVCCARAYVRCASAVCMCRHTSMYVSAYLYMCPHTSIYVTNSFINEVCV
jgi:hypothetical protein